MDDAEHAHLRAQEPAHSRPTHQAAPSGTHLGVGSNVPQEKDFDGRKFFHLDWERLSIIGRTISGNIVEMRAGSRFGRWLMRLAVTGRGYAKHRCKCPRKR